MALRKIRLMSSAGAKITVVAPKICIELEQEFADSITHLRREFQDDDIHGFRLITAATNKPQLNQRISELAQAINVPVNVVDQPDLCSFITPSIVDRSPVVIAISTGGNSPVLARMLRAKLEALIPSGYGRFAATMGKYRTRLKNAIPEERDRRRFWEGVVQSPIAEHFFTGRDAEAKRQLELAFDSIREGHDSKPIGEVWLIGAGPGDPDLLTFRALRLMQQADVVLYDRLVSEPILNLCRRDADRIYVGKKRSEHSVPQGQINQLLVDLAHQGKSVVRLKGGDPFIFGRGGEEIELLHESGVPFQIVPGITAASGCASYAGIPLTHRDYAQSCVFVTGHLKNGSVDLNWSALAVASQTVVIYMGLVGLPVICKKMIEHGVSSDMPIALIEQGTTLQQRVFTGTLASMEETIHGKDVHAPTMIIIGNVVKLHDKLAWYTPEPKSQTSTATSNSEF
ncbi:MAG: uroporphyrin-III C-methyltransferase/precorrin-2 dehydrogenase/sirohydrochlorin ferrochelatase [Cryomorphaceae bacterium]